VRSIPEYFERRFSPLTRRLATVGILGYMLGYIAIGFLTMAKTLQPVLADFLGWDVTMGQIVWAVAIVSGIYITFGGQTAVIFTDLLQGCILLVGGFILLFLGLEWLGGFDVLWRALPPAFKLPLAEFNSPEDFHFVGVFWQDGVAGSIGFLFLNQGLLMRFLACRSVDEGRKAAAFNTLFLLPLSTIVVCNAGWIGRAISGLRPDILPPETVPDEVFTRVAAVVSSPGVFAFLIAAVVAALMSTVDTLINAVAAVAVNDIYRPLVSGKPDRHYLKIAMGTSAVATVAGVVVAQTFFGDFATLYEAHAKFHTTVTPPLVAAVFLGAFWPRFNTAGALAVFVAGSFFILVGLQWPEIFIQPLAHGVEMDTKHPFKYMGALYNLVSCFSVGVLVTLLTGREKKKKHKGLTIWSVQEARESFKGGVPNDRSGRSVVAPWIVDSELPDGVIQVGVEQQADLGGQEGDLIYLSDTRRWLGGLRSTHAQLSVGALDGVLRISPDLAISGRFLVGREIRIEKEF
ncbi:MAG TPA: sodium:proline symporter, partial [Planctomycetes bacterium]|nr:sodium:proline symporter [Planctomycetota bacterium]